MSIKSERFKAVRMAWENERKLVLEGKGTRDWTPEQQRQIIEIGKALDEDGEAFEGHHMKNVHNYPEYAGNPENIQFLTKPEHKEAHKGSFRNPTNWYYNPETGEYKEFEPDVLEPCEPINLKEPVAKLTDVDQNEYNFSEETEETDHSVNEVETEKTAHLDNEKKEDKRSGISRQSSGSFYVDEKPEKLSGLKKVARGIGKVFNAIGDFTEAHPILSSTISHLVKLGIEVELERQYSSVLDQDSLDIDVPRGESSTHSTTMSEGKNATNIDIDNKVGNGFGSSKAPHFRSGFTRKIKTGIDDDGNPTFREVSVRSTYVHREQIDNNDD